MTDLILPRLPKSLQALYIDHGRMAGLLGVGVLLVALFIGIHDARADKVVRHARLTVIGTEVQTGDNRAPETIFTVTTPEGGTAQFTTQSAAILRDAGAVICAEELRSRSGQTRWEASPAATCR